jgi:peroxiredoxin
MKRVTCFSVTCICACMFALVSVEMSADRSVTRFEVAAPILAKDASVKVGDKAPDFSLIAQNGDALCKLRKLYGVPSTLGVLAGRRTFVIDKSGIVRMVFDSQTRAQKHVDKALKVLASLK